MKSVRPVPRLPLSAACLLLASAVLPAPAQLAITDKPETATAPAVLDWQTAPEPAMEAARQSDQPVILVFGAPWCEWCRKLNDEIAAPEVQAKLAGVTRVYLDFDQNRELAKKYAVGPIPALRILKSSGRVIAVQDGFMRAQRLADWLQEGQKAAAGAKVEMAATDDAPAAATITQIIATFSDPEAETREAAIRRLLPYPAQAAPAVTRAFAAGPLAAQLTALDLLDAWKAPIEKLDPWRPETITKTALEALMKWATHPSAAVASATQPLLDERQLADARLLIDNLLTAPDAETPAIRERLARYGQALLPTVYSALKNPPSEKAKERLTLLRYRLAASETLALQWPVGLERLASPEIKIRHSALEDLGKRVTAKDAPLLLQLFSDSDALVRETALRLLQQVGGPSAIDALAQLLKDPDPNVKAAVLKSVEEQPSPSIAAQIAEFVTQEKDPDLLVHAARVLRKAKGEKASAALYTLLTHENWRVRAEAAEALTELFGGRSSAAANAKADFYVRMSDLLDDPDGFVASKAMLALTDAKPVPDVAKVAATAGKHPELAPQAIKILAAAAQSNPRAADLIRGFAASTSPEIRAMTVIELTGAVGPGAASTIQAALRDPESKVRMDAATAIFHYVGTLYPSPNDSYQYSSTPKPAAPAGLPGNEKFVLDFTSGKTRPAWLNDFRGDLEKSLVAPEPNERVWAAMALIALGYRGQALPALQKLCMDEPPYIGGATSTLQWLPWDERLKFFNVMLTKAKPGQLAYLARGMAPGDDPRSAATQWLLLAQPGATYSLASEVTRFLRRIYVGSEYRSGGLAPAQKKAAVAEVRKVLEHAPPPNDMQRVVALALMPSISEEDAADIATKLRDDEKLSPEVRRDAFQIQLSLLHSPEGQALAADTLAANRPLERALALHYLVMGADAIRELEGSIYLSVNSESYSSGQPIVPTPPRGIKVEIIKPLLDDKDPETVAAAGYLLALLHDRSGIDQLIAFYKSSPDRSGVRRMVYRALTALDDDGFAPLLADLYKDMKSDTWSLREFYWTIRSMTGEKVMALRKQIRTEVTMENLR